MERLSTDRYLQARAFIYDRGRQLERLLFEYDFERAPAWPVLDGLTEYQNDDGGFGNGLEPDSLTQASGALATSVGLAILAHVGAPASHPAVRAAVSYLLTTIDPGSRVWRIVPEAAAIAPHAPWWQQEGLEAVNEALGSYGISCDGWTSWRSSTISGRCRSRTGQGRNVGNAELRKLVEHAEVAPVRTDREYDAAAAARPGAAPARRPE